MRVVVTGNSGQVASALIERGTMRGIDIVAIGRPDLDLAQPQTIATALAGSGAHVIVSAAAYTAVDRAESEPSLAFAVNAVGAGVVAEAAARLSIPIVHVSTDYVYDGTKTSPYIETDAAAPIGVYGASKLAGEQAVAVATPNHAILRTAWVYSPFGSNFLKTMLRLAGSRPHLRVVADQRGTPTSALDIADAILAVADNLVSQPDNAALRGVFHLVGAGEASWAEFAREIFAQSAVLGGPTASVEDITTAEYPTLARRPANSRLDASKLWASHGVRLPAWRDSTLVVLRRLLTGTNNDQSEAGRGK